MTAADRPPAQDDLPGLDVPAQPRGGVERAVRAAIAEAALDKRDAGAAELAASMARAVDLAHGRRDPYAVAAAGRELRECLMRLRMDPVSREGNDAGAVQAWLDDLGTPSTPPAP